MSKLETSPAKTQEVAAVPSLDQAKAPESSLALKREATVSNLTDRNLNFSSGTVEAGSQGSIPVGSTINGTEVGKRGGTYEVRGDMKIFENARGQIVVQPASALRKVD